MNIITYLANFLFFWKVKKYFDLGILLFAYLAISYENKLYQIQFGFSILRLPWIQLAGATSLRLSVKNGIKSFIWL